METHRFDDFDAFANSISGVDSKMLLRDPERRSWEIDRVALPGIELQFGRLGSGNVACGQIHSDTCMLYMPLTDKIEYRGNGSLLDLGSFFVLYPNAEFCITTKHSHDWCAVSIPIDQFEADEIKSLSQPCSVAPHSPGAAVRYQDIVSNVMVAAATCPGFEETQAARRAASELLNLLCPIPVRRATKNANRIGRPKLTRNEIVKQSLEILEENRGEHPSVAELAFACGVSERTLRSVFREYFRLGPSRFLQLRQLHDVRRALKRSDPNHVNVAQVMATHGVWSQGRFAKRYSNLFGELPSNTLQSTSNGR